MAQVSKFESPAAEYASLNTLNLHSLIVANEQHAIFFAVAEGNALQSIGLFDGDLMIANRARTAAHEDIVIAVVDGMFVTRIYDELNHQLICDTEPAIKTDYEGISIEAVVVQSVRCFHKLVI